MTRTHSVRRPLNGFTLIELLVVTLILSILMAVAIPLYLSSVADARTKTCQANMQTIANAVQASHVKAVDSVYTGKDYMGEVTEAKCLSTNATALPDLQHKPTCPNGGTYTVNEAGDSFTVSCSFAKDGIYTPGQPVPKQ